jgi:hypothetical protein
MMGAGDSRPRGPGRTCGNAEISLRRRHAGQPQVSSPTDICVSAEEYRCMDCPLVSGPKAQ